MHHLRTAVLLFLGVASCAVGTPVPTGTSPCADCHRFAMVVRTLASRPRGHHGHGHGGAVSPLEQIELLADRQLCDDIGTASLRSACGRMVTTGKFGEAARLTPDAFCAKIGECGTPEKDGDFKLVDVSVTRRIPLAAKARAADVLIAQRAMDTLAASATGMDAIEQAAADAADDADESGANDGEEQQEEDGDGDDEDDEDEDDDDDDVDEDDVAQIAAAAQAALQRSRTRVVKRVTRRRRVTRTTRSRKPKSRKKRKSRRRRSGRKSKLNLPKDYGYEIAKNAYKMHNSAMDHWQKMAALHEMAIMSGASSPISTSGMDLNADLYRPDAHTEDTFSDGASINQDLGLGSHGEDDDDDEMTQGAYDDPWLISIHPGLAMERELTSGDGNSQKRDLGSWLEDLKKRIILGNPNLGVHSYGMGMNQGGVLGTR